MLFKILIQRATNWKCFKRLALSTLGNYEILATDVDEVVERVLMPNVKLNNSSNVKAGKLDWFKDPLEFNWEEIEWAIYLVHSQKLHQRLNLIVLKLYK